MTLISAHSLFDGLLDPSLRIVDARFALADPAQGLKEYRQSHLPGARYVDLDADLSGPKTDPLMGRHPLPSDVQFSALLERLGIAPEHHVVVYDQSDGALAASRLWFLLVLAGHQKVSVLDGGLNQWLAQGFPLTDALPVTSGSHYPVHFDRSRLVDAAQLKQALAMPSDTVLLDARGPERFRGEVEPFATRPGRGDRRIVQRAAQDRVEVRGLVGDLGPLRPRMGDRQAGPLLGPDVLAALRLQDRAQE